MYAFVRFYIDERKRSFEACEMDNPKDGNYNQNFKGYFDLFAIAINIVSSRMR